MSEFVKKVLNKAGVVVNAFVAIDDPQEPNDVKHLLVPQLNETLTFNGLTKEKLRHNQGYVNFDENPQILRDNINNVIEEQEEFLNTPTQEVDAQGNPINTQPLQESNAPQERWQQLGYTSKQEWKLAGKP